jgi:RNA polymerase sigma-70 factor, ECF subfamily
MAFSPGVLPMYSTQPALDSSIQAHLGRHLQAEYKEVCAAPLPARLAELVVSLERALLLQGGSASPEFRDGLLKALPNLRAFAISLTRDGDRSDDLVQDTILRAWNKRETFTPGTNLSAWLFTILRNAFYSEHRKRVREVEDPGGDQAARLTTAPDQVSKLELRDLQEALQRLRPDQREALLLVAAEGMSYEDAAAVCGVAVGTIKSRVNRARTQLAALLGHSGEEFAADPVLASALNHGC